jgi:hypothetical protein
VLGLGDKLTVLVVHKLRLRAWPGLTRVDRVLLLPWLRRLEWELR